MAGSNDFTGQNIQDTYQRVLQLSSSGELADGTGSLVPLLTVTASHAISASHEITFELSSSHAQTAGTASFANNFTASGNISASGIGFFNQILVDGQNALDTLEATGRVFGDSDITKIEIGKTATTTSTVIEGNITASGNISSSGTGSFSDGRFSGKVGIGITSPAEKLHVIGNIRIDDIAANGSNLQFRNNGTPNAIFSNTFNLAGGSTSKTDFNAYVYNNNPFGIWTNNIRRLVVQGDGNISASGNFIVNEITASGNISASGVITADTLTSNNIVFTPGATSIKIEAPDETSGNIVGADLTIESGDGFGSNQNGGNITLQTGKGSGAGDGGNIIINAGGGIPSGSILINSNNLNIDSTGNITASGNISASGTIEGDGLLLSNNNGIFFGGIGVISKGGSIEPLTFASDTELQGKTKITGNVTASGDISASGDFTARSGSLRNLLVGTNIPAASGSLPTSPLTVQANASSGVIDLEVAKFVRDVNTDIKDNNAGYLRFGLLDNSGVGAFEEYESARIQWEAKSNTEEDTSLLSFWTSHDDTLSQQMTIDNLGNVGIGTTTPGEKLEVIGNISASGRIYGRQFEQIETSFIFEANASNFNQYDVDFVYMPFSNQSTIEQTSTTNINVNRAAVVPGKPVKSVIRANGNFLGTLRNYTMSYWEAAEGEVNPTFRAAVYTQTDSNSNRDAIRFDWSSPNSGSVVDVSEGSRIFMSLETNNTQSAGYIVTNLWEWDYNSI